MSLASILMDDVVHDIIFFRLTLLQVHNIRVDLGHCREFLLMPLALSSK